MCSACPPKKRGNHDRPQTRHPSQPFPRYRLPQKTRDRIKARDLNVCQFRGCHVVTGSEIQHRCARGASGSGPISRVSTSRPARTCGTSRTRSMACTTTRRRSNAAAHPAHPAHPPQGLWHKPEGAAVVSRFGPWVNPFNATEVGAAYLSLDERGVAEMLVAEFRDLVRTDGCGLLIPNYRPADGTRGRRGHNYAPLARIHEQLAGRGLACWCPLDQPCHADVLLELANGTAM
ncbi:DUF4326 domain-containing protein [Frigoribacterium sp. CFBP9030]|uniref:DUF4326 domain-containing protein n=1 Tax=Frigoribacterium sp. CFBP9030 TaxID=3096537 RepID=UPI002A69C836|nr:DUF4326 domain-containing protein [Frigoribacterium sp. CFBP9030]MDY0892993.1 DUF4326 domain-containing protein [Frigoribacterium sp. CFBP9030]